MKLKQMITAALQISSIAKGTFSLEHQNQGRELEKIKDSENKSVINLLSNKTQSHNIRHSEHRNKRNAHQPPRPLDEMQDDDLIHHYQNNFRKGQGVHEEIKDLIEQIKGPFYDLEGVIGFIGVDKSQKDLPAVQKIYEEFRDLKDKLLENESFMREQRKAIEAVLKEKTVSNRNNPLREYLEMYNTVINDIKLDKLRLDHLIADCENLINVLQESNKLKDPHVMNTPLTESPTSSPQEEGLLTSNKELSTDHSPNKTHVELPKYLRRETVYNRKNNRFLVQKREFEKLSKKLSEEIINEKPIEIEQLESLLKNSRKLNKKVRLLRKDLGNLVGRISQNMSSLNKSLNNDEIENRREAEEYRNQSKNELDNVKNLKNKVNHLLDMVIRLTSIINYQIISSVKSLETESPTESIKSKGTHLGSTSTTERPILSLEEVLVITRFEDLSNQFNVATKKINSFREQIGELYSKLESNKTLSLSDINETKEKIDKLERIVLRAAYLQRKKVESRIINEKKCIEWLVKEEKLSPSFTEKYIKDYDKFLNPFERTIYYSDNRRNKREILEDERLIEEGFINLLVKEGNMRTEEAAEFINKYDEPINQIHDIEIDSRRNKREIFSQQSLPEKRASMATEHTQQRNFVELRESVYINNKGKKSEQPKERATAIATPISI